MGWITNLAVYFVVWWITLFMVLPFGIQRDDDIYLGNDRGAPRKSNIGLKLAINTLVALVVWGIIYVIYVYDLITFR